MSTTRFCPTANGSLHVGHAYLALLNMHAARSTGGKFFLRFDDNQEYWLSQFGRDRTNEFCKMMQADLEWLGIVPDAIVYEHKEVEANIEWLEASPLPPRMLESGEDLVFPTPQTKSIDRVYPYVPFLTACGVAQDARDGVDLLIRGIDLITDFSLYHYFCRLFGIPFPTFQYVPKLLHRTTPLGDGNLKDLSDVSKTRGGFTIRDYCNTGWTPASVVEMLAESCLEEPEKGWTFENVRKAPVLTKNP